MDPAIPLLNLNSCQNWEVQQVTEILLNPTGQAIIKGTHSTLKSMIKNQNGSGDTPSRIFTDRLHRAV